MFTNTYYDTKNSVLHLWEEDGSYQEIYWVPYVFMRNPEGDIKTVDGESVIKKSSQTIKIITLSVKTITLSMKIK